MFFRNVIFTILIFSNSLFADMLFDKIENLLGDKTFQIHNNLLHLLFKDKNKFYINEDQLNFKEILQILKDNGLLTLKFKEPQNINIEFNSKSDALKSLKILNETLRNMGYYFYFTKEAQYNKDDNSIQWTISLKTEYIIDPFMLVQELKTNNCNILNITKVNDTYWKYYIDINNAKISEAVKVDNNEKVTFQKPLRAYFIEVNEIKELTILSRNLNEWFPYVVFYDEHLNILNIFKRDRIYKGLKVKVPHGTKYIKITDLYTLNNIKRGLTVITKE